MPKPYRVKDHYFRRAKTEGYRARSVYKLKDIQNKYRVFKPGQNVLDLGAAPGSFLQSILEFIGPNGYATGVDLQKIDPIDAKNLTLIQADIFELEPNDLRTPFDVVTSDMAPKTSGIKDLDQARSVELADAALDLAIKFLNPGGHFVVKVFEGEDFQWFVKRVKKFFSKVHCFKPPSTRDRSRETFVVGLSFKPVSHD